ncbi:MAG: hypothetical protein ABUT20_45675, partial [Bacteroidota bacterium]
GYGMEEEALRAIKSAKQWEPEVVNGEKVNAYKKQPVTFVITSSSTTEASEMSRQNLMQSVPSITVKNLIDLDIRRLTGIDDKIKYIQFNIIKEEWANKKLEAWHQIHVNGFELNSSAKDFLKNVQPETLISFDDIYVIKPGKEEKEKIPSLIFKIV